MFRRLLHTAIALAACMQLHAQARQYVFTRISTKDRLASDHVYSIVQDKKGFMWIGSANGLQRYDGRKFIAFRPGPNDTSFLPPHSISQLLIDKKERFWIRMEEEVGILNTVDFSFRRMTIDAPRGEQERSEMRLWQDNDGNIFLLLSRYGILVYNERRQGFVKDTSLIDAPYNSYIIKMQQDPQGNYWLATADGLMLYHRKHRKLYTHKNNPIHHPALANSVINQPVISFLLDSQQRMWIGNWPVKENKELFSTFDLRTGKLTSPVRLVPANPKYHELNHFTQQQNGHTWAFGLNMLAEYNPQTGQFIQINNEQSHETGIRYDAVHCLYEDRENNIWLGTDKGIYVFNPGTHLFTSMSLLSPPVPGTPERSLTQCLQLKNGDIWMGSWGQGIVTYDSAFRQKSTTPIRNIPADYNYSMVWSMLQHSITNKIWVGCQTGRLMIHDPATGRTRFMIHPAFNAWTIRRIAEDKDGNLWFGTQHGLVVKWDAKKGAANPDAGFEVVQTFRSHIQALKPDAAGMIWVGSSVEGLSVLDASGKMIMRYNNSGLDGQRLLRNMVTDVLHYNDSLVVICAGGLNVLNRKTGAIDFISAQNGLPSNTVNTVQRDEQGNLWVGLIDGLCRYNMKRNVFTLFSERDGIVSNNFKNGNSYVLRDGRMVFGNPRDFIFFDPGQVVSSSAPPDVRITDFKLFNTYLPPDSILQLDRVILNHDKSSISIEYATLSFLQKYKMVYYVKMEGIDQDWMVAQSNAANYTLLPPGDYVFKVRCENGDGIPSKNITSLKIHVRPPFWRQEWFILLSILALGGLIYLAHRFRVNRLMEMEKVRGRIARDLHDDMGSTLSTINILSEMAKMKVGKDTEKTSEYISKISDNSNRMMEAMDDIVWSINPMNDSMQRITARMREFATGVLEAKDIEVTFRVDEGVTDLRMGMEKRRDFFLLFKEAVNNAAKYSGARHVSIDISLQQSNLVMQIRDDGMGFDVQQADSGNGLTNMRKRAQSMKGSLTIDSLPGLGTKVRLEAPLT